MKDTVPDWTGNKVTYAEITNIEEMVCYAMYVCERKKGAMVLAYKRQRVSVQRTAGGQM